MSQENVDAVGQALEAFNRRDRGAFLALCDPDVKNVPPTEWPESDPIQGRDAVWDFYVEAFEPWEDCELVYGEVIDAGNDTVAAHMRGELRGKTSGAGVAWSFWQVITFRDGKMLRARWFVERADALEAVGLSE